MEREERKWNDLRDRSAGGRYYWSSFWALQASMGNRASLHGPYVS